MVVVRPFRALRPKKELASKVASFPYDVISSAEARELADGNEYSFLHVVKPEIDLDKNIDLYDERVYLKAKENLYNMIEKNVLIRDKTPLLYIYKQKMGEHEQYGLVSTVSADDYNNDIIKKHEFTRKDKEDDRTKHVLTLNANTGPVFLTYRDNKRVNELIENFVKNNEPEVDFTTEDGITHTVWVIEDKELIEKLVETFKGIDYLYVADGHHRSASAARAKFEKMKNDPNYTPDKDYNFFLAVLFPASQLKIMDYNRVLYTLNGLTKDELFKKIEEKFNFLDENSSKPSKPKRFGLYIDGKWYQIEAKEGTYPKNDPVKSLDVAILQDNLLAPILGIGDPRVDKNIGFVGGIRGTEELERLVDSGKCKLAFSLYPTDINQLMAVADADKVMPPKSTWFEPKLRSGLFVNLLGD